MQPFKTSLTIYWFHPYYKVKFKNTNQADTILPYCIVITVFSETSRSFTVSITVFSETSRSDSIATVTKIKQVKSTSCQPLIKHLEKIAGRCFVFQWGLWNHIFYFLLSDTCWPVVFAANSFNCFPSFPFPFSKFNCKVPLRKWFSSPFRSWFVYEFSQPRG